MEINDDLTDSIVTSDFKNALIDYVYLKERNYPEKPALKLIGDYYRLNGRQRIILYRGITQNHKALERKSKLIEDCNEIKGKSILIDGYNVLFTIMNFFEGKTLFVGNDGCLKDTGNELHQRTAERYIERAVHTLIEFLKGVESHFILIYLDKAVVNSLHHFEVLNDTFKALSIDGAVQMVRSADLELVKSSGEDSIIGTSDSEVIDSTPCRVIDAARYALKNQFELKVLKLNELYDRLISK